VFAIEMRNKKNKMQHISQSARTYTRIRATSRTCTASHRRFMTFIVLLSSAILLCVGIRGYRMRLYVALAIRIIGERCRSRKRINITNIFILLCFPHLDSKRRLSRATANNDIADIGMHNI